MPAWLTEFLGDRIQINSVLIVLCFVSVLVLSSQSAASYPSYLLALSVLLTFGQWNDVFRSKLSWLIAALLTYLCLSALWSHPFGWWEMLGIIIRALLVATFVVAMAEVQLRGQVQRWLGRAVAAIGIVAAALALGVYFLDPPHGGRLSGLGQLDNPVVVGLILGTVLVFWFEILLADPSRQWRLAALLGMAVVAVAIFLSGSRNAWVSTLIGLLVLGFSTLIRDKQRFAAAAIALLVVLIAAVLAMISSEAGQGFLLPRGDSFRMAIWAEVLDRLMDEGVLVGLGILTPDMVRVEQQVFNHPHNMYLAIVFQGGLIALALFAAVVVGSLQSLYADFHLRGAKLGLALLSMALASYLLDGHELIDKVGETWFLFWLPVAISLGLSWNRTLGVAARDPH